MIPGETVTEVYYNITYEGNHPDLWYECGGYFDSLDDAKQYIKEMREDCPSWHAFEVTKHTVVETSELVYTEE